MKNIPNQLYWVAPMARGHRGCFCARFLRAACCRCARKPVVRRGAVHAAAGFAHGTGAAKGLWALPTFRNQSNPTKLSFPPPLLSLLFLCSKEAKPSKCAISVNRIWIVALPPENRGCLRLIGKAKKITHFSSNCFWSTVVSLTWYEYITSTR